MPTNNTIRASSQESNRHSRIPALLVSLAALYWLFQVAWFWRYSGRNINIDAVSYVGIARHVAEGNFVSSFHGYWSPLISWLIAPLLLIIRDRTLASHLLMLPAFGLCLALVHRLTTKLWHSPLLSGVAVLWFTAARAQAAFSVFFVGADLLLTAAVLAYFILLLACLEQPERRRNWLLLGIAHCVAFLAKAIAMPLLALATAIAVLWMFWRTPRKAAATVLIAAIFPALIWAAWGTALHRKYGVFTTGYQLRWNLLDPAVRQATQKGHGLAVVHDTQPQYDAYMVTDSMSPGSPGWHARIWRPGLLRQIVQKERENVPIALKQFAVLLTPGGLLALVLCMAQLTRHRKSRPPQFRFLGIVLLTVAALVGAYSMLVFDARYVLPVTPVLIALAVRFALPPSKTKALDRDVTESPMDADGWQTAAFVLLVVCLLGVQVYWASPFRTLRQDFQLSVYDAANTLKEGGARNIVAIGSGPYPDHGVGWEAGVYAAYFSDARIVAELYEVPPTLNCDAATADVQKLSPDAVMLWGTASEPNHVALLRLLEKAYPGATIAEIRDPRKGVVGAILVLKHLATAGPEITL